MARRITKAEVPAVRNRLLIQQKNQCALCGVNLHKKGLVKGIVKALFRACLDHCHVGGQIRGVLCNNCNGIEGKIFNLARRARRDGTEIKFLANLTRYWHLHRTNQTGLTHPNHLTSEETRLDRNKKARLARAKLLSKRKPHGRKTP